MSPIDKFRQLEYSLQESKSPLHPLDHKIQSLIEDKVWDQVPLSRKILSFKERVKVSLFPLQKALAYIFERNVPGHFSSKKAYTSFLAGKHIETVKNLAEFQQLVKTAMEKQPLLSSELEALIKAKNFNMNTGKTDQTAEQKWKEFKQAEGKEAENELLTANLKKLAPYVEKLNQIEEQVKAESVDYKPLLIKIWLNTQEAVNAAFSHERIVGADQMVPLAIYLLSQSRLSHDTLTQIEACYNELGKIDKESFFSVAPLFPIAYLALLDESRRYTPKG